MNHGILIHLYHPSFTRFLRVVSDKAVKIDSKPGDYSAADSFIQSSAVLYRDEAKRVEATRLFLDRFLGRPILTLYVSGMRANGACQVFCRSLYTLAALKEDTNEIGSGGRDPSNQRALNFRLYRAREEMKPTRDRCYCSTSLIAVAGP
ncbi:hypothetical protein H4582DRAFT_1915425 [Lactarius indigo]|nr:hypothetical protein H4582DRAFT_1915425 [Lactarius indigo]